ncbi:MAG: histidine kinase [Chloroflexota bacterium]
MNGEQSSVISAEWRDAQSRFTDHGSLFTLPLTYQGEVIGELRLAPRAPNEPFSPADRRLLEDIAHQAGVAAHAVRLTADLQRSRERLVTAREEERRRLRRDLHDGLGSQLAALNLQAGVLRGLMARDPAAADAAVVELRAELQAAIANIRRVVYELRPPTLDEFGLVGACQELAQRLSGQSGTQIVVDAPAPLPPLPAAVEVAAYRITQEAVSNVVKHAGATRTVVRIAADGVGAGLAPALPGQPQGLPLLIIEITDDGRGLPATHHAGVGLHAMRERAAELGGTCEIETIAQGGTRVTARLPISTTDDRPPTADSTLRSAVSRLPSGA